MKFGSSWVITAPCKKDGIECSKRVFGCRNTCPEYAEYERKLDAFKRNMFIQKNNERNLDNYFKKQKARSIRAKNYER